MDKQEAIERLKQNKAAAEFYAGMIQNTNAIENELKDIEAIDMAIEALSAEVVPKHDVEIIIDEITKRTSSDKVAREDGRNNMKRYPNCQMRTSLGNCDAIGGFCTSINAPICDAFHKLVKSVHGEWIEHKWAEECDGLLISNYECTNCHSWERNNTDFCPNCGAIMKGEQNVDK